MSDILSDFSGLMPFLDGSQFNENLSVKYKATGKVPHRSEVIRKICTGKRVIHVGCTDHVPLIKSKIEQKDWLHGMITECSSYTLGLDIDAHAVGEASRISGLTNMVAGDITAPEKIPEIFQHQFDIALFGEVVEHISNPVDFLKKFLHNYRSNFENLVITVPNAFRGGNIKGALKNYETINSDHRFFFTPYTIAKIAVDASFTPERVTMATFTRSGGLKSWLLNHRPLLAEDIILIASHGA